jgi:uncharacterized beta-barrel protein YwiB (DUF1934 family)
MNNIIIDIKSSIDQGQGEVHKIDISTEAEWFEKNGSTFIVYHETEVSGMEGSKTMLKIHGDTITMTRFGATNSKIVYDVNHPMRSAYNTPYGTFEMSVFTEKLDYKLEELSGYIHIDYNMALEGVSNSKNQLRISIRKVDDETIH